MAKIALQIMALVLFLMQAHLSVMQRQPTVHSECLEALLVCFSEVSIQLIHHLYHSYDTETCAIQFPSSFVLVLNSQFNPKC